MIRCRQCGTENLEDSMYCDACGANLASDAEGGPSAPAEEAADSSKRSARSPERPRAERSSTVSPAGGTALSEAPPDLSPSDRRPRAKLLLVRGGRVGREFPIWESEVMLGRWDAEHGIFPEIDLDEDDAEAKVSRRHARIFYREGRFWIEDLGSLNGTFVNRGPRLRPYQPVPLRHGDEIIVGKTFLRFLIEGL
ncbi:Oxoglutarate dehydrogenase inhibitor [bacterium HR08]|nr:Oxoglutarate dehydrogenase inhibitor [bacterium HR08]